MKTAVLSQLLLAVAIVLLGANLAVMFAVHGATPAEAQGQSGRPTCTGIAALGEDYLYTCWSDGSVHRVAWEDVKK